MIIKLIKKSAAVAFWILIWQLLAAKINQPLIVPAPRAVFERLYELSLTHEFWDTVFYSLWRITVGIGISLVVGLVFGVLVAKISLIELIVNPVLSLIKATPVASFILLALLWMDSNVLPTFISILIVVPVVISNVSAGVKSIDKGLGEVAEIFRFSVFRKIKRLFLNCTNVKIESETILCKFNHGSCTDRVPICHHLASACISYKSNFNEGII